MLDALFLKFATWLGATEWSIGLHESFYMFNWVESTHVITLMLSLGLLVVIDLRMMGVWLTNVPASKISDRLFTPMIIGFSIMVVTGLILFTAIPVRYTQSIWFRLKLIFLFAALINAWLLHRHMARSISTWDTDAKPPKRTRIGAALSLSLWTLIVMCGRFIAYDWYDCGKAENSDFMNWAIGCTAPPADSAG